MKNALVSIEDELDDRIAHYSSLGHELERHRIEQRTRYDLEMIREIGHCQSHGKLLASLRWT